VIPGQVLLALASLEVAPQEAADAGFGRSELIVPTSNVALALRDLDGDGAQELVRIDDRGFSVEALGADGSFGSTEARLSWPSNRVAWDLVDLDGDGRHEVVWVVDGRRVEYLRYESASDAPERRVWSTPTLLIDEACFLPFGVSRVGLARDVDGNGRADLVLPGPGVFRVHLDRERGADGNLAFAPPIEVAYEPEVEVSLGDPEQLSSRFSQSVRVPWFRVEDFDGDGALDLVSETSDRVAFHLARPTIATQPTWTLDLAALRGEVGRRDVDLDDVLAFVSGTAQWRVADLDGVAPLDLVVGAQGTYKVYLGGAATGPRAEADQVLKASGNVLYFFLRNVRGDERADLQILRGERLSLAKLLRFLILPGRIEFELFTYQNIGGAFDRKPTQRNVLALRIPRLLGFVEKAETMGEELRQKWTIPARRLAFDADGRADDVVDVRPGANGAEVVVLRDCAGAQERFEDLPVGDVDLLVERLMLADLDRAGDGAETVIDIGELDKVALSPSAALRERSASATPAVRLPLPAGPLEWSLRTPDIDGDGRADIVAVGKIMSIVEAGGEMTAVDSNTYSVVLFVRR
jgi:hypothetical protein